MGDFDFRDRVLRILEELTTRESSSEQQEMFSDKPNDVPKPLEQLKEKERAANDEDWDTQYLARYYGKKVLNRLELLFTGVHKRIDRLEANMQKAKPVKKVAKEAAKKAKPVKKAEPVKKVAKTRKIRVVQSPGTSVEMKRLLRGHEYNFSELPSGVLRGFTLAGAVTGYLPEVRAAAVIRSYWVDDSDQWIAEWVGEKYGKTPCNETIRSWNTKCRHVVRKNVKEIMTFLREEMTANKKVVGLRS